MDIQYRSLDLVDDLEHVVDLEVLVWGLNPRDAVPSSILHAIANTGGLVVGAYDTQALVGMALMFPTDRKNHKALWSHNAAVHPDYQGHGIGFGLKQFQRRWALDHGYQEISWTFDPLQKGNANFNLHILGATTNVFHVNFYGDMNDGLNAGLPSDRVEVTWSLRSPRVRQLAERKSPTPILAPSEISDELYLLKSINDHPVLNQNALSGGKCLVEIPAQLNAIKQQSLEWALEWRLALREAFQKAFQAGYTSQDFIAIADHYCYVLVAQQAWYLYVLECNDQTLYTGITPDLAQRLAKHNKGQGAAYTKTRRPVKIIAAWQFANRQAASKAEFSFKQLSRQTKLNHILQRRVFQDAPFVDYAV